MPKLVEFGEKTINCLFAANNKIAIRYRSVLIVKYKTFFARNRQVNVADG